MSLPLVCVLPFAGFSKGEMVVDPDQIADFRASRPFDFVQVNADAETPSMTWSEVVDFPTAYVVVAASRDGTKIVAAAAIGAFPICLSTDGSVSYSTLPASITGLTPGYWQAVAASSDMSVIAGVSAQAIAVSINGGASFASQNLGDPDNITQSVAMSGSGAIMIASTEKRALISTNTGSTFPVQKLPATSFSTESIVAASRDGSTLLYGWYNGQGSPDAGALLRTRDNGGSWVDITPVANIAVAALAISADGQIIYAVDFNTLNVIFKSTNGGDSWATLTAPVTDFGTPYLSVCSDDGQTLIAMDGSSGGNVYVTTDGAGTWIKQTGGPGGGVNVGAEQCTVSGDGSKLIATNPVSSVYYTT